MQEQATAEKNAPAEKRNLSLLWLALGPIAGLIVGLILPDSLSFEGKAVAGCAVWMALWWVLEPVPIPVTSLLPIVLFPVFNMGTLQEVANPYANSVVLLVLGGVLLGVATEKSGLHIRIALYVIKMVGTKPSQIVLGLMIASAFISAWISNTATAVIMVPIATSILTLVRSVDKEAGGIKFGASLLLGVAYGVTIGSTATPIGQPPMALMKAFMLESYGYDLTFGRWMMVGVPWAIVMTFIAWIVLTKLVYRPEVDEIPGGKELINDEIKSLGAMSQSQKRVATVFLIAIFFWTVVPFISEIPAVNNLIPFLATISDTQVAIGAAILCFIVRSGKEETDRKTLLIWEDSKEVPWGLLLLFGGGLSLSAMFTQTGFSAWVGEQVETLSGLPAWAILLAVILVSLVLTEMTSNTATAAGFFPIFGAVAVGVGIDPMLMTIAVTLAVCSAYMLPVATPSNAVAFGSGEVTIKQMVRAGFWLNIISIGTIMLVLYTMIPLVFGVSP